MFEIEFRVITKHVEEAVMNVTKLLRENGINVYDLREADIVQSTDNSKQNCAFILCCKGSVINYLHIKQKYFKTLISYEGVKTLM